MPVLFVNEENRNPFSKHNGMDPRLRGDDVPIIDHSTTYTTADLAGIVNQPRRAS
jgi:hypothetical protein